MVVYKCKMCGGSLDIQSDSIAVCQYCGAKQTLPSDKDDIITNLFLRANNLRIRCDFDKAEQIYEKILERNSAEPEAYWGIVLCRYGIEYVEDPASLKRIPTCHRTSYEPITRDKDFLSVVKYASPEQLRVYQKEANTIENIQRGIINIAKNEKPFDVFICYKETDENGRRTIDSSLANDIYHQLTQEGLKVFFAPITLEDKLGQEYEPYIFAALNSVKVMLVIGTKIEYFEAVWVRNEWSRYLKLMQNDRSKLLIPCYRDMDAYELPEEFAHLQAQDMGKIGFINDIIRGIKKVILPQTESTATDKLADFNKNNDIVPLLKRITLFLEDEEFIRADEFCEQVLNIDPENAEAYFDKLLIEYRCASYKELIQLSVQISNSKNYSKILRFGDQKIIALVIEASEKIGERIRKIEVERIEAERRAKEELQKIEAEKKDDQNWSLEDEEFFEYVCPHCKESLFFISQDVQKGTAKCPYCDMLLKLS